MVERSTGAATASAIGRDSFTDPSVSTSETAVGAPPALGVHTLGYSAGGEGNAFY